MKGKEFLTQVPHEPPVSKLHPKVAAFLKGYLAHEKVVKSGAGTAFYDAVDPRRRKALEQQFLDTLWSRQGTETPYKVVHDYISCIARKM